MNDGTGTSTPLTFRTNGGPATLQDRVQSLRLPSANAGRGGSTWLPWTLCVLLAASTSVLGYMAATTWNRPAEVVESGDKSKPATPGATTTPSTSSSQLASSGDIALEAKGYVIPAHQIQVSPKVGGMIVKLYIREEGQRVKKDEILAELETTEFLSDFERTKAALESAKQRLLELEHGSRPEEIEVAKYDLAESQAQREQLMLDWKRNSNLKTGNALAQRELEQAYSSYLAMDRHVERLKQTYKLMVEGPRVEKIAVARADVKLAEAEMLKTRWRLDNCTVRAPLTGTILTKKAEEGNMVNPAAFSNGLSASLCDMADLSDLEIDLNIQERDVARVSKDQKCTIRPEAFPDRLYQGYVSRLMPIADRAKGAVPVRVKVSVPRAEEGVYLKPEMGVIVAFKKKPD